MIIPTIPKPLADGIYFAIRLDFEFTAEFSLVVGLLDGRYRPPDRRLRVCHPLESVLLGQKAIGEKLDQIAELVGVDRDWIDGFCDSLRGIDVGTSDSYRDGYCLAKWPELRRWIEPLAAPLKINQEHWCDPQGEKHKRAHAAEVSVDDPVDRGAKPSA